MTGWEGRRMRARRGGGLHACDQKRTDTGMRKRLSKTPLTPTISFQCGIDKRVNLDPLPVPGIRITLLSAPERKAAKPRYEGKNGSGLKRTYERARG